MSEHEATTTCVECGLTYFYDPRYHLCADKGDPKMLAQAAEMAGTTWVEECMTKQYGERGTS